MPANDPQKGETWRHIGDGELAEVLERFEGRMGDTVSYCIPMLRANYEYSLGHFRLHFAFVSEATDDD